MSIGLTVNRAELDAALATVTMSFREASLAALRLKAELDRYSLADMQAWDPQPAYSESDANLAKSAAADLARFAAIWFGDDVQATPYEFETFAGLATGFR